MDSLVFFKIFSNLNIFDKIRNYYVFNQPKPSQFTVAKHMLQNKNLRTLNGLKYAALSGDYELCVQYFVQKNILYERSMYENHIRSDFIHYDECQLSDRILFSIVQNS